MTTPYLQSLISDLDRLLSETPCDSTRPIVNPNPQSQQYRQILLKVRAYLASLSDPSSSSPSINASLTPAEEKAVEQIVQAVVTQISHRLEEWFQALEGELHEIRFQRELMASEIQKISQNSQVTEIIDHLIQLQHQSDQLLVNLDLTFRNVFETLETDLQGYYLSLSQGLKKMHDLGRQKESQLSSYLHRFNDPQKPLTDKGLPSFTPPAKSETGKIEPLKPEISQEVQKISLLTDLIPPEPLHPPNQDLNYPVGWYLGIDLGTSSLMAVLSKTTHSDASGLNEIALEQHWLTWSAQENRVFKLPIDYFCENAHLNGLDLDYLKFSLNYDPEYQSEFETILTALLSSFNPNVSPLGQTLKVNTANLSINAVELALNQLNGVILTIPCQWGEMYRLYGREAVLQANLIENDQDIIFVPEAIATLLAYLPLSPGSDFSLAPTPTLVINSGATSTDLALISLPIQWQTLSYEDFALSNLAYGGHGLEEDIFCHLIYPQWRSQVKTTLSDFPETPPTAGRPDRQKRARFRQYCQINPLGMAFLEAARLAKLILQQQEEFTSHLKDQPWSLHRQDLENQVIYPFLEGLKAEIKVILREKNLLPQDIQQIILSGGNALSLSRVFPHWIAEEFAEAKLINNPESEAIFRDVSQGLARLPLFPILFSQLKNYN